LTTKKDKEKTNNFFCLRKEAILKMCNFSKRGYMPCNKYFITFVKLCFF